MADRFQVDLGGMVDLLSRHLYSGPQVYLRELLQNAVDAMTARGQLPEPGQEPMRVRLRTGTAPDGQPTLSVTDTGIGLTADQARELLATIGRSSKRDSLLGEGRREYIGQFGIGMLAAFMVADEIEVISRSYLPGSPAIRWKGRADGTFSLDELDPAGHEIGSQVRLVARRDCEHWLAPDMVTQLARDYAGLLPVDLAIATQVDGEEHWLRLTEPVLPWRREYSSRAARDQAMSDYCQSTFGWQPLASIPLEVPVAGVSGVAFVLPQAVAPGSGSHRVYTKQMLLGPRVDKILPEWAFFVRAVINADSLTPTASREDLHEDEVLWQVREALGEQLKSWLTTCLSARGSTAQAIIKTHHLALRAVALTDTTVLDLCARVLPYETTDGLLTLAEARGESELLYTSTTEAFRRVSSVARAQGLTVVNAGYVYDADLVAALGSRRGWPIRELEAKDVVHLLCLPTSQRLAQVAAAVARAEQILQSSETAVMLREFDPAEVPAIVLVDPEAERRAALHAESEASPDLWGGLLGSLDTAPQEPARTLVLNDRSEVTHLLLDAYGEEVFDAALTSLHLSAVMLAGEGLGASQARAYGAGLAELLRSALRPGTGRPG
ncbi:MAG: HSP90 family protein [Actinomyces urogenitalis]|uniref:HSP90 family protein n=3 Tax=root TaxID=1 RepID=A0A2I1KVL1_9ACTO|nr:HSP90 family protein [Actinomyces urogenitalis]MDK8237612.1 HSP90 family protein [Actinomyces urogenitalis]MDU0971611.1 HSP90 family protein [Actinomyces urogenitalis]PKY99664.1 HSP90 family protein [Actinomyces urogenitalis]WOO94513.1 HSP90 family protein [Actinomyces urogenitalis]